MRILLISFFNTEAYGLRILHSILMDMGHELHLLFIENYDESLIIETIKKINPDVMGISIVSQNFQLYKKLYPHIRAAGSYKIVLGGWHVSLDTEGCLDYCDIACIGEGEVSIKQIIHDIQNSKPKRTYQNSLTKNLNYPLYNFSSKNIKVIRESDNGITKIFDEEPYLNNTRYGTILGRGCPYSCTYCSNSYMKRLCPDWSSIRYRKIDHVITELKNAKNNIKSLDRINFYDEVFLPKKEWIDDFCHKYKKYIDLPFYCMFYPGTCNKETAQKLSEAGLKGVWIGVQSGSEKLRSEIFKRYYSNKTLLEQVDIFTTYNINCKFDFIFDNPFETPEDRDETLNLINKLPAPLFANFFSLKFFPNTEITKMALEKGLKITTVDQTYEEKPEYLINEKQKTDILNNAYATTLKSKEI